MRVPKAMDLNADPVAKSQYERYEKQLLQDASLRLRMRVCIMQTKFDIDDTNHGGRNTALIVVALLRRVSLLKPHLF